MKNKKMRAYSIEDLLIGKWYRSPNSHKEGEIISAVKRDEVWAGDNATCYLIEYRDSGRIFTQHATISVSIGE
jgi:hypothetical protein